jgi:hemerythrin-like domain-containing protein
MEVTNILMEEHRVIERVLAALDEATRRLEQGQPVRSALFLDAADFIEEFADGCHSAMEKAC